MPGVIVDTFQRIWNAPLCDLHKMVAKLEGDEKAERDPFKRLTIRMAAGTIREEIKTRETRYDAA